MNYQNVEALTRSEAEEGLASRDISTLCETLLSISFHESDQDWALEQLSNFASHPEQEIRTLVATCIGHVGRIHRRIDLRKADAILKQLARDPSVVPFVDEARADLEIFVARSESSNRGSDL